MALFKNTKTSNDIQRRKIGPFDAGTKETFANAVKVTNDEVGTADYLKEDPYRHSLALMEIIQNLLQMGIEIGDHIKSKGTSDKAQASFNRIQRILRLTFNLETVGDMNVTLLTTLKHSRIENTQLQQRIKALEQQLEASRKAFLADENLDVS